MLFCRSKRRLGVDISFDRIRLALMRTGQVELTQELDWDSLACFVKSAELRRVQTVINLPAHLVFCGKYKGGGGDEIKNDLQRHFPECYRTLWYGFSSSQYFAVRQAYLANIQSRIKASGLHLSSVEIDSFALIKFFKIQNTNGIICFITENYFRLIHFNERREIKHAYYPLEQLAAVLAKNKDEKVFVCNYHAENQQYSLAIGLAMS